jgi:hypothetical protein
MFKKFLVTTTGISLLCISITGLAAQTTLDFQNPKLSQTKSNAPIPPSEFSNQVKSTNTKNHNQFKQQLDQKRNDLSHPSIPTLSQVQSMSQTPPPTTLTETIPESTNNENVVPQKETKSIVPNNSEQPISQEPMPVAPNAAATTTPPPQKPAQGQPYTGFPTQSSPTGSGTQQKDSGGFSIKY